MGSGAEQLPEKGSVVRVCEAAQAGLPFVHLPWQACHISPSVTPCPLRLLCRDLANTCFRLPRLATALVQQYETQETVSQAMALGLMDRLQRLGVRDGMAADRAGVGCCYVGCDNLGGWEEAGLHLSRCGGCRNVRYCSR